MVNETTFFCLCIASMRCLLYKGFSIWSIFIQHVILWVVAKAPYIYVMIVALFKCWDFLICSDVFYNYLFVFIPPEQGMYCNYCLFPVYRICSEDEARMKIYSVSTRHYYAFGALVSEEVSYKIKGAWPLFLIFCHSNAFCYLCLIIFFFLLRTSWSSVGSSRFLSRCEEQGLWR